MTIKPESNLPLSGVTENGQFKIKLWWDSELKSGQTSIFHYEVLDTFLKDRPIAVPYDLKIFHDGGEIAKNSGVSSDSKTERNSFEFFIPSDISGIIVAKFENLDNSKIANLQFPLVVDRKDTSPMFDYQIPEWVKNNAGWWADGQIPDSAFIDGIEYLVKNGLIVVPITESNSEDESSVPKWIKINAGWWADGQIDDKTFATGIEYLVKNGLIVV
jgi:hypothetical protein